MKPNPLRIALVLSFLINLGVLGAIAYRAMVPAAVPAGESLPRHLQLSPEQLHRWHESEAGFLRQISAGADQIRAHRDRMIRAVFADTPDQTLIDRERMAIARLQDEQQKLVIAQLLRERELLQPAQRERLAQLLLAQPVGPSTIEQLHRD
ncbi:MAG: periplasmic heavy metal sensor [Gammaproteobacteria bacterium]|nr:periplasmic heavy metal sensor [Rhodocyclaceae bacterium]MBU3910750.1 periplasmic heavy metal sensor [Gammaproteobacteria bacterium]MBU3988915.1 periplasmic heavy metal sensor [Gammaproteobacteria bacterium]MBU4003460.1 periplasmic heavy metal sensor [Gammaproteobacteria bacterium]MBU4021931.1 periplasmic heavy metal sensor [Gammaproteobacteria bacterium]